MSSTIYTNGPTPTIKSSVSLSALYVTPPHSDDNDQLTPLRQNKTILNEPQSLRCRRKNKFTSKQSIFNVWNTTNVTTTTTSTVSLATSHNGSFIGDEYLSWPSFQPNYTKMMNDNNLLESCKEANRELKHMSESIEYPQLRRIKSFSTEFAVPLPDPTKVLTWIRYMENYLTSISPSFREIRHMNPFELRTRLGEHIEVRRYIGKRSKSISEIVRAVDRKQMNCSNIVDIENRYLQLFLKAIEVQCSLENPITPTMQESEISTTHKLHFDDDHDDDDDDNGNFDIDNRFMELRKTSQDIYKLCDFDLGNATDDDFTSDPDDYLVTSSSINSSEYGLQISENPLNVCDTTLSDEIDDHCTMEYCSKIKIEKIPEIDDQWEMEVESLKSCNTVRDISSDDTTIKNDTQFTLISCDDNENCYANFKQNILESQENDIGKKASEQCWNDNYQHTYKTVTDVLKDDLDESEGGFEFVDNYIEDDTWIPYPEMQEHESTIHEINESHYIPSKLDDDKTPETMLNTATKLLSNLSTSTTPLDTINQVNPDDFQELIKLCRENIDCLRKVLRGQIGKRWFKDEEEKANQANDGQVDDDIVTPHKVIIVEQKCRCSAITRFIGKIIDFLLNWANIIKNYVLYSYFMRTISNFYLMIKYVRIRVKFYQKEFT